MQEVSQNTFTGGLDRDSDLRTIKNDSYIDANDVDIYSTDRNSLTSISPLHSSELAFTIPDVATQSQIVKFPYAIGTKVDFSFYDAETNTLIGQGGISALDNNSFGSFSTLLDDAFQVYGYNTYNPTQSGDYFKFTLTGLSIRVDFAWYIDDVRVDEVILQEAYVGSTLAPLAGLTIENRLFLISGNSEAIEIGIAKKEPTWSYTRIFRTWRWNYSSTEAIDFRVESINSDQWAIYITDNVNKPKVYYIPKSYTTDCIVKYDNTNWITPTTNGYLIYNFADEQTNLQLVNNTSFVKYHDQSQNGGALVSGGYRYSIRCGINGTENTTEWSVLNANVIPVFKTSIAAPSGYIKIQGDKSGEATGKSNILKLENLKPNIFNYVELACVYNAGGATSAYIVGKYPITDNIMYVTHSGLESGTQVLDATTLPQTEPLIKTAKTSEIKKNRINFANVDVAADEDIADEIKTIFDNSLFAQYFDNITGVGTLVRTNDYTFKAFVDSTLSVPWNTTLDTNQTGSGYIKFQNSSSPVYDPATGIWTVAVSGKYRINTFFWFTPIATGGTFTQNWSGSIQMSLSKTSGVTQTTLGTFTFTPNNQSQGIDVSVDLTAGDTVGFIANYDFKNALGTFFSIQSGVTFQPSAIVGSTTQDFANSQVGEYQLPENCANKVGYTIRESYPFFAKVHYTNGYVSSPIYIGSKTFTPYGGSFAFTNSTPDPKDHTVFVNALSIQGLDVSSLADRVDGISIWRGVCNPTILGTGVVFAADSLDASSYTVGYYPSIPVYNGHYNAAISTSNNARNFGMFISPDTQYNKVQPSAGDKLIFMGTPQVMNNVGNSTGGTPYVNPVVTGTGSFAEYYGRTVSGTNLSNTEINITDGEYITFDAAISEANSQLPEITSGSLSYRPNTNIRANGRGSMEGMAIALADKLVPASTTSDNGVYMAQYKRTLTTPQYDLNSLEIVPTGTFIPITPQSSVINDIYIYGGDTYTQKNILKVMYWGSNGTSVLSSFITYYGQSKINTQLFYCDENEAVSGTRNLQGWKNIVSYLFPFQDINTVAQEQFNYDKCYSADYPFVDRPYDPNIPQQSKFGSRIYYSEQKPLNSVQDFYRKILALNFRDLDSKNGDIAAIRDVNNYMVAFQPRAVSVLPYLSDVVLSTNDGNPALVGTGGVYNQRENIISTYGTNLQTCVLVGQNNNGNSQAYWYSNYFKKYLRYGGDGIRIESDENNMRSFFLNDVVVEEEYDMVQTFDSKYASAIITMLNTTDKTLFFNEKNNSFSTFASFKPTRYFQFNNVTLAPKDNRIYELFGGAGYLTFLGDVQGEFSVVFSANKNAAADKRFYSVGIAVGDHYTFTEPTISLSVKSPDTFPYNVTKAQLRQDNYFAAFGKDSGVQPIGQYGLVKIVSSAYIEIFAAFTKHRNIFRTMFR